VWQDPRVEDSDRFVGLLADGARRRAFAAVVLGARDASEVVKRTALEPREAARAIDRLCSKGLLVQGAQGFEISEEPFAAAQRRVVANAREGRPTDDDEAGAVLRRFVRDGRLVQIPVQHGKRMVVLAFLAALFDGGQDYPEAEVNRLLNRLHDDHATLRRLLVDEGFLTRDQGVYRRVEGSPGQQA
jgi:hypothetical protein